MAETYRSTREEPHPPHPHFRLQKCQHEFSLSDYRDVIVVYDSLNSVRMRSSVSLSVVIVHVWPSEL